MRTRPPRILFYSHDTFGLGHIRRTRTLAMALADAHPGASVLILTGSPLVGRFDFPHGIDFVRIPGVVKLPTGAYATHNMGLDIAETVDLRRSLIRQTARVFDPDLMIVDKEPTGFRREVLWALKKVRERGARVVLGVRDVLDEPVALAEEWRRKKAVEAVERYYDDIWVYGLEQMHDPLENLPLSPGAREKVRFTGYLRREAPEDWPPSSEVAERAPGYVLVTPGGGGDGETLIDWVLRAYESVHAPRVPLVVVFGPFLSPERRAAFEQRARKLPQVTCLSFVSRLEQLMQRARGVVAMGGYNTFCEILSFDKPAVIVPRRTPRLEQAIRAEAAARLGLMRMLEPDGETPAAEPMIEAIQGLATQPAPSASAPPGLLDGLERVVELAGEALGAERARRAS